MEIAPFMVVLMVVISIFSTAIRTPEIKYTPQSSTEITQEAFTPQFVSVPDSSIQNFIAFYAPKIPKDDPISIAQSIVEYGREFDVDSKLITGLIAAESRFNKNTVSNSGAQGLGQLLPGTATSMGVSDPFDIRQNVMGTTRYLKLMLNRWRGRDDQVALALASYKDGFGAITRSNGNFSDDTRAYIQRILKICNSIK